MKIYKIWTVLLVFTSVFGQNLVQNVNTTSPPCFGMCEGAFSINIQNNQGPLILHELNSQDTTEIGNVSNYFSGGLCAGYYVYEIIDSLGQKDTFNFTIEQPDEMIVNPIITPQICSEFGSVIFNTTGGIPAYIYTIGGVSVSSNVFSNLFSGTYVFQITDNNGCSIWDTIIIPYETEIEDSALITPSYCNDGNIQLFLSNGSAPYEVSWNTGDTLAILNNLGPGTYTANIVDAVGCELQVNCTVPDSSALSSCSSISGNVYNDINLDCINNSELGVPNLVVKANPGNFNVMTDANGDFTFHLPYGTYDVSPYLPNNFSNLCTPSLSITTSAGNPYISNVDFGIDPEIDFTSVLNASLLRRIMDSYQYLYTRNNSNITANVGCYYVPDPDFTVDTTYPAFHYQNGDTLFWENIQIEAFSSYQITIKGNTSNPIGTHLHFCHGVISDVPETDSSNNDFCKDQEIIGSYDPNDKRVYPDGDIYLSDQKLQYHVRFQNTGNDTAFNIVVMDTLSYHLDPASFQFLSASHYCIPELIDHHILKFTFPNILLVDSLTDEPNSHGHFIFEINQNPNNQIGDVIENDVAIYFDYNEPIFTNTAVNTIIQDVSGINSFDNNQHTYQSYPNPFENSLVIEWGHLNKVEIQIWNYQGQLISSLSQENSKQIEVDTQKWNAGLYFIQIKDQFQTIQQKVIKL